MPLMARPGRLGNSSLGRRSGRRNTPPNEGFTDTLAMHAKRVMSLAMMSNRITDEQVEKVVRLAREVGYNRVGIMHFADGPGDDGTKDTLWKLLALSENSR